MCNLLGVEGLLDLCLPKLDLIIELHLEQCELDYFPDVSSLASLKRLHLQSNEIEEVSISLNLEKLEEIYITKNPIKEVDFKIAYVPSLRALHFGSKSTTHVKLACLKGLVHSNVKLVNYCRNAIQFPPGEYLQGEEENNAQLLQLCSAPEKALVFLDSTEKQFNLLTWIFEEFEQIQGEEIHTLNLKGYKSLMNYHLTTCKRVEPILNSPGLKAEHVKSLTLNSCGLKKCPDLISFRSLTYLDIGNNDLKEWPLTEHHNLRTLILSGNPLGNISDSFEGLRSLSNITLGSKSTNYITTRLLAKMAGKEKGNLVIEISRDEGGLYRKCLKLPPYSVLADDNENLSKYLKRPDQFLTKITSIDERINALHWLVSDCGEIFDTFSLAGEKDLCAKLGVSGLQELFETLQTVKVLNLSGCGLANTPDFNVLSSLSQLDLSQNNIKKVARLGSHGEVKKLFLQGNPLKTVDVEQFPSLTYLQCGCDKKWQIDPRTLRKFVDADNSLEEIEVPSDFREPLQFPPYEVLKNGPNAVQSHMDNEELDLSGIEGANDDLSLYIPRVENAEKPIRSIRLSGVPCLPSLIESNPSFKSLMAIEKLKESVEFLYIDKCNIDDYPVKIILPKLTEVHLSKNVLKQDFTIPDSIEILKVQDCELTNIPEINHLKSLDIKGNKINCIKFDRTMFPNLTEISIGAPTRFISYNVLKLCQNGYLKLTASDELYLPPNKLLSSQEGLLKYFKCPEKYLRHILDVKNQVDALHWLMDDRNDVIEEFDLSGQPDLCRSLQTSGLNKLLMHEKLVQNVKVLKLDNCDLTTVPDIDKLSNIKLLSLKDNKITLIGRGISNSKLEELHVQGNPIETFHIDFVNLQSLTKITCGSIKTTIIARSVIERVSKGLLELHVKELYHDTLQDPPIRILQGSRKDIEAHLNKKEIDLSVRYVGYTTKDKAMTMIRRKEGALSLRLSDQISLFKDKSAVKSLLATKQLKNIQRIHMDNCNLQEIPDVSNLKQLAYLDTSNNSVTSWPVTNWVWKTSLKIPHLKILVLNRTKLDKIPSLITCLPLLKELYFCDNALRDTSAFESDTKEHPLETLDISGNEITTIHINTNSFPSLKKLICGSNITRYISVPLLRSASSELIEINVPDMYKKYLLVPSAEMLQSPKSSLTKFLSNKSINLKRIVSAKLRYEALEWLFSQREKFYTNLILTRQTEFCDSEYLPFLLQLWTLNTISHLYLNGCNLTRIPIPSGYLLNLKHLDVSENSITEITYDPPQTLERLHIEGNPINTLQIKKLPKYESKVIQAGSEYTRAVDIDLLESVAKGKLTIEIISDHRKHLVLPPYEVLEGSCKTLAMYVREIKLSMLNRTRATRKLTKNVALLLGSSDVKSSLKAALTEGSLIHAPTSNVKQVERSTILFEQGSTIPVLNFQDSNSYVYSLDILRGQHKIVIIAVDLMNYDERNHCSQVTKWLRGFVLDSNCKFILVPIALDLERENKVALMHKLVEEWRNNVIGFLKETMNFLKSNIKEGQKGTSQNTQSSLRELERSLALFERLEIIILPTKISDVMGINKLKGKIKILMESEQACLPFNWQKAIDFIEKYRTDDTYYISFSDLTNYVVEESPKKTSGSWFSHRNNSIDTSKVEESVEECLRYLNAKGVIIWHEHMKEYVFNYIEKVLEVYGELFRDDIHDLMRQSYHIDEHTFDKGLLSKDFLGHLWSPFRLTEHELHRIIDLLKINSHCFDDYFREGETKGSLLKFPFFFKALGQMFLRDNWPQRVPHGFVQFSFMYKCFDKFPSNVMGKISTELQRHFKTQFDCYRADWQDGIYIQTEKINIMVQRQMDVSEERQHEQLVVSLRAHYPDIFDLWELCVVTLYDIVNKVMEANSVMTYKKMFICPHCILTERPLKSAHKRPLGEVMQSRWGTDCFLDYFLDCPNPDTANMKVSTVPAAFFQPIIVGETFALLSFSCQI